MAVLLSLFLPIFGQQSQNLVDFPGITPGLFRGNATTPTIIYIQNDLLYYLYLELAKKSGGTAQTTKRYTLT